MIYQIAAFDTGQSPESPIFGTNMIAEKDLEKHIRDLEAEIAALSLRVYTLEDQAKKTNTPPNWYIPYQPVWCRT